MAGANSFVHPQDLPETDLLLASDYAAQTVTGGTAAVYHLDNPAHPRARPLAEEVARVVRARAANSGWIDGMKQHGFRGAAEIAATLDHMASFAHLAGAVPPHLFDLYHGATLGDPETDRFPQDANPEAHRGMQARFTAYFSIVLVHGDPGVFAMAAAVFEAVEAGPRGWRDLNIDVLPGITAMLAAAARVGAPLGHDSCAINLSDNLKPWALIDRRLRLAAEADFAMAFYNPRSNARPEGFARVLEVLNDACRDARPVIFARAVTTPQEAIRIMPLPDARPEMADMRTMILVGTSATRVIARNGAPFVYTPRSGP